MASHDLHFTVSQNGIEDPNALHDPSTMPLGAMAPQQQQQQQQQQGEGGNNWGQTLSSINTVLTQQKRPLC